MSFEPSRGIKSRGTWVIGKILANGMDEIVIGNNLVADSCDGDTRFDGEPTAFGRVVSRRFGAGLCTCGSEWVGAGATGGAATAVVMTLKVAGASSSGTDAASEPAVAGLLASVDLPASAG